MPQLTGVKDINLPLCGCPPLVGELAFQHVASPIKFVLLVVKVFSNGLRRKRKMKALLSGSAKHRRLKGMRSANRARDVYFGSVQAGMA